jgi:zinc protease
MEERMHSPRSPRLLRRLGAALGLATALVTTAAAPALAQPAPPPAEAARPARPVDPTVAHEKYVLPNGLEVILIPDNSVPLVAVSVWYHVGSGYETVGKSGFAHLFEHMLFQGSKNVGSDKHFEILKKIGMSTVNGTTNPNRTNYFEVVPSHQLDTALWLESDRMGHLLPLLTLDSLKNQIDVVRNERRQRYDNVPYGKTRFALYAALYPEGHPYRYLTIGKHEDLEAATLEDVRNFYKTWYVPANATLAITGDFDQKTIKATVARWFGGFPKSTKPTVVRVPAPTSKAQTVEVSDGMAKLRQIQWAWHSPAVMHPGDAEFDILADVLAREGTGRLYKALVYDRQLAQSVSAFQQSTDFSSIFSISVTLRTGADLEQVKQVVAEELARLRREPISDRERARAVTAYEAQATYGLESLLARGELLQGYNHSIGRPDGITYDLDRYRQASPATIQAAVTRYLADDQTVTVITNPAAAAAAGGSARTTPAGGTP